MSDRKNTERKVLWGIAIISLLILGITGGLLHYRYKKTSERISQQYEVLEAEVMRKYISTPIHGSGHCYVVGKTPDDHEQVYWGQRICIVLLRLVMNFRYINMKNSITPLFRDL